MGEKGPVRYVDDLDPRHVFKYRNNLFIRGILHIDRNIPCCYILACANHVNGHDIATDRSQP
ncbi:hypothetical protein D3C85_1432890 [compost metagenome]